jgi:hypothetical protein
MDEFIGSHDHRLGYIDSSGWLISFMRSGTGDARRVREAERSSGRERRLSGVNNVDDPIHCQASCCSPSIKIAVSRILLLCSSSTRTRSQNWDRATKLFMSGKKKSRNWLIDRAERSSCPWR